MNEERLWKDVDYTYDDIIQTDEYRKVIDLGSDPTVYKIITTLEKLVPGVK